MVVFNNVPVLDVWAYWTNFLACYLKEKDVFCCRPFVLWSWSSWNQQGRDWTALDVCRASLALQTKPTLVCWLPDSQWGLLSLVQRRSQIWFWLWKTNQNATINLVLCEKSWEAAGVVESPKFRVFLITFLRVLGNPWRYIIVSWSKPKWTVLTFAWSKTKQLFFLTEYSCNFGGNLARFFHAGLLVLH